MRRKFGWVVCSVVLALLVGCSRSSQQTAQEREAQARVKADQAAKRLDEDAKHLGHEAKEEAHVLGQKINSAIENKNGTAYNGTSEAEQKIERGGQELKVDAGKAAVKLDRAALAARVKAKLASDVGLSTVTAVDVDASGQVVTLRGTVDSVQQKQLAEQAALQVSGVTRVVDDLTVKQ